ncbi:MAG: tRNA 2-thiouridine(34) synthase MnmA [Halieaceae bacterium]|nr:tRNA 2-thiouridine(34) synthase MnmA [Halieaceae bacterium]
MKPSAKILAGMSGGVDSSVSALLLQQQGYQVEGLFMKNWDEDDGSEYCSAREDLADAQQVAGLLGIPLHCANFAAEYWDNVFEHFLREYRAGRTPNPDVLCNREIKFKVFLEYALALGADYIATGHYVRGGHSHDGGALLKGLDRNKEQSYFLHSVSCNELEKCLFPVGELEKTEVRALARRQRLPTHDKKDSTGICFIGERRFKDFLQQYLPAQPGPIRSLDGALLGQHQGLMYHTIGQRQGLGIGGMAGRAEAPWYVAGKNLQDNELIVVQGNQHAALYKSSLLTSVIHWVSGSEPELPLLCAAKIRYRQPDQACTLHRDGQAYRVDFETPQRAITPGQSVVLYLGEVCLGGGVIEQAV